jgi:hypothetical protein
MARESTKAMGRENRNQRNREAAKAHAKAAEAWREAEAGRGDAMAAVLASWRAENRTDWAAAEGKGSRNPEQARKQAWATRMGRAAGETARRTAEEGGTATGAIRTHEAAEKAHREAHEEA